MGAGSFLWLRERRMPRRQPTTMRVRRTRFLNINTPRDEQDFHGRTGVRRCSSGSGEAVLLQDASPFNPPL